MRDFATALLALATCPLGLTVIGALALVGAYYSLLGVGRWIDRRAKARVARMTADVCGPVVAYGPLDQIPLPAPDAPDAEFEAWALQAVNVGNSPHRFDTTLAQIRALETYGETA